MNSRQSLQLAIDTADYICMAYVSDLSDSELMLRPHPECNHINWQLGHLIASEHAMINGISPGTMPPLPAGFAEKYTKETATSNDPTQFATAAELMSTHKAQRAGTIAALAKMTDEGLDAATGVDYAPTVGSMFAMQSCHWLMHSGQWVIVRRNLGKKIVI